MQWCGLCPSAWSSDPEPLKLLGCGEGLRRREGVERQPVTNQHGVCWCFPVAHKMSAWASFGGLCSRRVTLTFSTGTEPGIFTLSSIPGPKKSVFGDRISLSGPGWAQTTGMAGNLPPFQKGGAENALGGEWPSCPLQAAWGRGLLPAGSLETVLSLHVFISG